ncbi:hypothetical protein cand_037500 [Cryptosporidium andersoni]|uniref:Uncharacterized protein n=1 Tax=Cryptosporidium andersoni TaxID=117008 RepID=A0A1J4MUW7_9CRYT|nr:hypothetical protein cand_037500 [Cryptosporidium andersoni]
MYSIDINIEGSCGILRTIDCVRVRKLNYLKIKYDSQFKPINIRKDELNRQFISEEVCDTIYYKSKVFNDDIIIRPEVSDNYGEKYLDTSGINNQLCNIDFPSKFVDKVLSLPSRSDSLKFGLHPQLKNNFLNYNGCKVWLGSTETNKMKCISVNSMSINAISWSPHFFTGTFVTCGNDAVIRVYDVRTESDEYSFLSYYNTTCMQWNPVEAYYLAALHDHGNFMSVYDIRGPRCLGILPRNIWISSCDKSQFNLNKTRGNFASLSWVPYNKNLVLINELNSLYVIDISFFSDYFGAGHFSNIKSTIREGNLSSNGIARIVKNSNFDYDSETSHFSENSLSLISRQSYEESDPYLCRSLDFIPNTSTLVIFDCLTNRLLQCNILSTQDYLSFQECNIFVPPNCMDIFIRKDDKLIFHSISEAKHLDLRYNVENDSNFETIKLKLAPNIESSSFPSSSLIISKLDFTSHKKLSLLCLGKNKTQQEFGQFTHNKSMNIMKNLLQKCVNDILNIYEKKKSNPQLILNILFMSVQSSEKVFVRLRRHTSLRNQIIYEDNREKFKSILDGTFDSFEFHIILSLCERNDVFIHVTYHINRTMFPGPWNSGDKNLPHENSKITKLDRYSKYSFNNYSVILPITITGSHKYLDKLALQKIFSAFEIRIQLQDDHIILTDSTNGFLNMPKFQNNLLEVYTNNSQDEDNSFEFKNWTQILLNWPNLISKKVLDVVSKVHNSLDEDLIEQIVEQSNNEGAKFPQSVDIFNNKISSISLVKKSSSIFSGYNSIFVPTKVNIIKYKLLVNNNESFENIKSLLDQIKDILKIDFKDYAVNYSEFEHLNLDFKSYCYQVLIWLNNTFYYCANQDITSARSFYISTTEGTKRSSFLSPSRVHDLLTNIRSDSSHSFNKNEDRGRRTPNFNRKVLIYIFNRPADFFLNITKLEVNNLLRLLEYICTSLTHNYNACHLVKAIKKLSVYIRRHLNCIIESSYEHTHSTSDSDELSKEIQYPFKCCICLDNVYGLYTRCVKCSHGGHTKHFRQWFENNRKCPQLDCLCKCNN